MISDNRSSLRSYNDIMTRTAAEWDYEIMVLSNGHLTRIPLSEHTNDLNCSIRGAKNGNFR